MPLRLRASLRRGEHLGHEVARDQLCRRARSARRRGTRCPRSRPRDPGSSARAAGAIASTIQAATGIVMLAEPVRALLPALRPPAPSGPCSRAPCDELGAFGTSHWHEGRVEGSPWFQGVTRRSRTSLRAVARRTCSTADLARGSTVGHRRRSPLGLARPSRSRTGRRRRTRVSPRPAVDLVPRAASGMAGTRVDRRPRAGRRAFDRAETLRNDGARAAFRPCRMIPRIRAAAGLATRALALDRAGPERARRRARAGSRVATSPALRRPAPSSSDRGSRRGLEAALPAPSRRTASDRRRRRRRRTSIDATRLTAGQTPEPTDLMRVDPRVRG